MKVPQVQPWIDEAEVKAVSDVVRSGWITEGEKCQFLAEDIGHLIKSYNGVFAPNGTLALYLGLVALGIEPGDEVVVPDVTFIASANAVLMAGAKPIFCEVDSVSFQMTEWAIERVLTDRTKAIMPVHLYGMCVDMEELHSIVCRYGLYVIEDAAQALGIKFKNRYAGTWGDVGCFSFFADKSATMGEGGYVTCRHGSTYEKLLYLRNQGRKNRGTFIHPEIGYNFRITDIQAAMGLVQLKKLPETIKRKKRILELYHEGLDDVEQVSFLVPPEGSDNVPFRVFVLCRNAHTLMKYLSKRDIATRTSFYPLHKQPCFEFLGKADADPQFYNACYCYDHGVCLPAFPELTEAQIEYVCDNIKEFYKYR